MRDFGHRLGEDAEIYFYLYDGNPSRMRVLSERFVVRISKNFPKNCTVFTDLGMMYIRVCKSHYLKAFFCYFKGANELGPDLYLVATVVSIIYYIYICSQF
jgi:DOCK N-terminus